MPELSARPSSSKSAPAPDVVVIGAGVIGAAIALRLRRRGARVTLFDAGAAGSGASAVAAGMLAACVEAEPTEDAVVALARRSQALWPAFALELESASDAPVDLRTEGTLVVATTADDRDRLRHRFEFQRAAGLPVAWITPAEARLREPHLGASIAGAVWSPEDHQVDPRKVTAALRTALERDGVTIREHTPVAAVEHAGGRVTGVRLAGGEIVPTGAIVVAAGAWSRGIDGVPTVDRPPVRPIKGQIVTLRMDAAAPLLNHVLWAPGCYVVPRRDGRLLIGATVEEKGFDTTVTAGGVLALLEAAWRVLPGIEELPFLGTDVGLRPGTRDDAPILGTGSIEGLHFATGHHRHGVLLAPVTAEAITMLVLDGIVDPLIAPFGTTRFVTARAA